MGTGSGLSAGSSQHHRLNCETSADRFVLRDVSRDRSRYDVRRLLSLPTLRRRLADISGLLLERGALSGEDLAASLADGPAAEVMRQRETPRPKPGRSPCWCRQNFAHSAVAVGAAPMTVKRLPSSSLKQD